MKRTFTLPEANRSLVLVKRIVGDVIFEYAKLLDLQEAVEAAEAGGAAQQGEASRLALIRTAGRLRSCLEELDELGVELKDWSLGVVDFPSMAGGRQVMLCWQYGQENVAHWHELDVCLSGRQPIETLPTSGTYVAQAHPHGDARAAKPTPRRNTRRSRRKG
jgi:hypothetical protein